MLKVWKSSSAMENTIVYKRFIMQISYYIKSLFAVTINNSLKIIIT